MATSSSAGNGKTVIVGTRRDDEISGSDDGQRILGGNGNDVLAGNAGADHIYGGAGDDTISGGGGNDELKGDAGNDTLDGGAGSDEVEGGSGNDVAIYVMAENAGSHDEYDGGAGVDTLRLVFTRDEWMRPDVQSDIARYLAFIAANTNASGQANGHEFQFTAFGLEATKFEKLEVMVDGQMLDPRDQLADAIDDTATATEDGSVSGNVLTNDNVPDLVRSVELLSGPTQGQLTFNADGSYTYVPGAYFNSLAQGETATQSFTYRVTDADGDTDTATVTITITGTNDGPVAQADTAAGTENQALVIDVLGNDSDVDHGAVLHVAAASVAAGQGSVTINADNTLAFNPGTDFDHLAQGVTATVIVNYTVSDEHNATDAKTVTITVTGTNDAPVMEVLSAGGGTTEDGVISATGQLTASDVDDGAVLTWSAQNNGAGTYGTLTVDQNGQWSYALNNAAANVQALAAGEVVTDTFTVQVADEYNATDDKTITITITGTNDAPLVSVADVTGTVTEAIAPIGNLTDTGTLAFTDLDITDAHSISAVTPSAGALGTLTAAITTDTTGSGTGGVVTWNYSVDASAVEYLAAGQTKVESFIFDVLDGNGGSVPRTVSVTLTGTNDAPVITAADATGTVTAVPVEPNAAPEPLTFTVQQYLGFQSNDLNTLRNYATTHAANYTVQTNVIDYTDDPGGFAGELPGSYRWPAAEATNYTGTGGINNVFFARITADFSVSTADTYTFRTYNDDGVFLLVDNQLIISDAGYHPEAPFQGSIALAPGNHTIELFFYENGGEASLEFSARNSTGTFGLVGANGGGLGGAVSQVTDSGVISFGDVDLTDAHLVSAAPVGAALGTLTATRTADTTGTGTGGQLTWSYSVANSAIAYLAEGETKVESFNISVNDQHGGVVTKQVDITITGTNDGPVAQADTAAGTENQALVIDVLGNDSDVDHGAVLHVAAASVAAGQGSITINPDNTLAFNPGTDFDHLAQGVTATVIVNYTVSDEHGATDEKTVTITVTGTNDGPVITSGAQTGAVAEDHVLSVSGQITSSDVDDGATATYTGNATGAYGSFVVDPATGAWTYALDNGAHQNLAAGETHQETFLVTVADDKGATATQGVTVTITGTNDAPVITSGATSGAVTEDGVSVATGHLTASDVDNGATQLWSVQGGTPSGNADFHFNMDSITIVRNGVTVFQDNFSDGIAPPIGPNGTSTSYTGIGSAVMTESGGRLHLDSNGAVSFIGVGNPDPVVGVNAIVRTDINPSTTAGLKSSENFTVTGVFDLILPDSPRESYGIRLTDRVVGGNGTPPDQLGDNVVEMRVTENAAGELGVRLRQLSFVSDTVTTLQSIALAPPPGADQIRLNLTHSTAHVGDVTGTFEYLHAGSVIGTQTFSAVGHIFQGENFVRAELIAAAPAINDSILGGTYGNLTIDQTGTWTYTLDNTKAATQALGDGQHATDTFTVQVADEHGATDSRVITVDVTGANDAPLMQTGAVARTLTEDVGVTSGNLTATGEGQFADVDVADVHTMSAVLSSASLSTGAPISAGLAAALNSAVSTTLLDPATGDGHGQYRWDFALANSAVQSLGAGQTLNLVYNVTATDNHGASATQQVTLTVAGANDAPVAVNDTNALTVTSLASVVSTNTVHWVDWTAAAAGQVTGTIDLGNGQTIGVTYKGEYAFAQTNGGTNYYTTPAPLSGDTTFGTGTYTSTAVGNGPTGSDIIALSQATQKTLTFSQPVDNLFFAVVSLNGNGYLMDQDFQVLSYGRGYWGDGYATKIALPDGRYEVVGNGELHGVLGIDGTVQSLTWTSASPEYWNGFTVGTYGKAQTATATGNVLANDSDPDAGDTVFVSAVNGHAIAGNYTTLDLASGARVTVNKDGTYLYDEDSAFGSLGQGQTAVDSFTYTVTDNHGASSTGTVNITVTGINDGPVAVNDTAVASEDTPLTISAASLLANDTDPDSGDTKSLVSVQGATHGTVSLANGNVTFTPDANYNGTASFGYTMKDAAGATSSATVNVTVNAVNDAPSIASTLRGGSILFIDDDGGLNGQTTWLSALAAKGYTVDYEAISVNANPVHNLNDYGAVIWSIGDRAYTNLTAQNVSTLQAYLNGGGRLLYAGGHDLYDEPNVTAANFAQNYLGVNNYQYNMPIVGYGTPASGELGNVTLSMWSGGYYDDMLSGFNAAGGTSRTLLELGNGTDIAAINSTSVFRAATWGFDLNHLDAAYRNGVLDGTLKALGIGLATNEDTALSLAGITVSDVDAGTLSVTLGAGHGALSVTAAAGLTGLAGNGSANVTVTGSASAVNEALAGLSYTPDANYNGTDALNVTVSDLGNTGSGGALTASSSYAITVRPVSDTYTVSNLVTNGSFEQFTGGGTSAGSTAITGWTVTGSDVDRVASSGWQSGDGSYSLDLNGFHPGGVQQVLATTPGVQYTVGFELSKNPGNTDHATVLVSAGGSSQSYTFSDANTSGAMKWSQQTFSFTATGTSTTLSFASTYPTDATGAFPVNAQGPALDEVVMVSNKAISNFTTGAGGDVLQLHDVLTSVSAPHDSTAFSGGFVRFLQSGSDTVVQVDANGGGDSYLTLATLANTLLTQADTANYVL